MQKNFTFFDQFRFLSKKKKLQYQTTLNTYETVHQILRNEPNRKTSKNCCNFIGIKKLFRSA